jgi:hypothetical protein
MEYAQSLRPGSITNINEVYRSNYYLTVDKYYMTSEVYRSNYYLTVDKTYIDNGSVLVECFLTLVKTN